MKFLLLSSIFLSVLPLRLEAQTATESYATGLAAEKTEGDREKAAIHYREVLQQYQAGQTSSSLAFRARERLSILGEGSALESPLPPRLPFQALGDQFGVTTDERITSSRRPMGGIDIVGFPLRPRYADSDGPNLAESPSQDSILEVISRQIRALRYALGITGLLEYVEEMTENNQRNRQPNPHELYQAGLIAEHQRGHLEEAITFYDRALATKASTPAIHYQIDRRLARCRERLARRDSPERPTP
jgi:tetratricopeptide (TPR) repeat protein